MMFRLYELTRRQTAMFAVAAVVLVIAVAAAVYSCRFNHTYPKELTAIDSLCESRPDSAMALLEGMPKEVMEGDADRMYYGLLKIKAANNLYMVQKDSTIFHIVDYFEDSGDKEKLRDSYYFLGKYYVEHNDAPQALKCFQTALDMADDKTPLSFKSKVYSQSGTLFLEQDMFDDAIAMYRNSYVCDSLSKDTINMINGLRDIAQAYLISGENKGEMIQILEKAYSLSLRKRVFPLMHSIAVVLAAEYVNSNRLNEAATLLDCVLNKDVESVDCSAIYCLAAKFYERLGQRDSMAYYCHKLMSIGDLYAKEYASDRLMVYYSISGNLDKVRYYININRQLTDSVRTENSTATVARINSLYNYGLREKENILLKTANIEKNYVMAVSVLISIIVIIFILCLNERNKKKCLEYEQVNGRLKELCDSLTENYKKSDKLQKDKISELEAALDQASSHNVDLEGVENSQKLQVYDIIRNKIANKKTIHESDWCKIEMIIDSVYPNFRNKLYCAYKIDKREYRMCILIKLGLRNSDIAIIMCRTKGAISLSRASMYEKVFKRKGTAKDFDDFIRHL